MLTREVMTPEPVVAAAGPTNAEVARSTIVAVDAQQRVVGLISSFALIQGVIARTG